MTTLDQYLDEAYRSIVLNQKRGIDNIMSNFRNDVTNVPGFREMAIERLQQTKGVHEARCFVTKTNKNFLEEALNG